ncbi:MAG: cyclic nucleotide-binding domain-containing protein [Ilumatobacteraceae bacterium]
MTDLVERCADLPRRTFSDGEVLVAQGAPFGSIVILVAGSVSIDRDGVPLAVLDTPGAVLGEMSTVLDRPSTATVRALSDCTVLQADDGAAFLLERPDVLLDVARALATRLDNLTGHLTDVKRQYAGDSGHLGMLDEVLSTLMHHQTKPVTPGSARMPDLDY